MQQAVFSAYEGQRAAHVTLHRHVLPFRHCEAVDLGYTRNTTLSIVQGGPNP